MLIYADIFVAVNLLVNFVLLVGVALLTGSAVPLWRLFLGACVGAAYATLAILMPTAQHPVWILTATVAMLGTVFWPAPWRQALTQGIALVVLAAVTAGIALVWGRLTAPAHVGAWPQFTLLAVVASVGLTVWGISLWWQGVRRGAVQRKGQVWLELQLGAERVRLRARIDSANDAYEPISGEPVTILSEAAVRGRIGPAAELLGGGSRWARRVRVVPVRGLGGGPMLLPALRVDRLTVTGEGWAAERAHAYVALYPGTLDPTGRWHALVPSAVLPLGPAASEPVPDKKDGRKVTHGG